MCIRDRFLPARIDDNPFLLRKDPGYRVRLQNLDESRRRALMLGEWDLYEGQFFSEFRRETHVVDPFPLPSEWKRVVSMDYGLDCFACYFIALAPGGEGYVYREIYESDLLISQEMCIRDRSEIDGLLYDVVRQGKALSVPVPTYATIAAARRRKGL